MKIGIDYQTALGQKTGFGFYVENLVKNLEAIDKKNQYILFRPKSKEDFSTIRRFWWDQFIIPAKALKNRVDILHQPAFAAPIFYPGKIIITVHDLIAMFIGSDIPFISRQYFGRWMPLTHKRADHIITISEHTKKDIINLLKIPEEKITVIPLAASQSFKPIKEKSRLAEIKNKFKTGDVFFLHVGTITPRKNLELIVSAFAELAKSDGEAKLVIAGKKGWFYEKLHKIIKNLAIEKRVVFTDYITEEEKILLYNAATALVFPSIYEGFGLPPLEAMSCGLPVIASSASSIPEVVGEAGILLDPNDLEGWAQAMRQVIHLEKLRQKMSGDGLKQAKKFSWQKTAEKTIEVYEKVYRVHK